MDAGEGLRPAPAPGAGRGWLHPFRRTAVALLLLAASLGVALDAARESFRMAGSSNFGDYDMYWFAAAASLLPPGTDVYLPAGEKATNRLRQEYLGWLDPAYPDGMDPRYFVANSSTPFLFAAVARLSTRDFPLDFLLFQGASTLCILFALHALLRWGAFPAESALAALLLLPLAFAPYLSDLGNAAPTRILVGLAAAAGVLLSRGRPASSAAAGALLGLAVLLKPIVVLAPPFLFLSRLRTRRLRLLAWEAAGFAFSAAAGGLLAAAHFRSWSIWLSWARHLAEMPRSYLPVTSGNFSLVDLLAWAGGPDLSAVLPPAATALLLLAAWRMAGAAPGRDERAGEDRRAALTLWAGCAAFLLASSRAWVHYYLLSLPLLLALWGWEGGGRRRRLGRRALVLLAAAMLSAVRLADLSGVGYSRDLFVSLGWIMWGGALLAFGTAAWTAASPDGEAAPPPAEEEPAGGDGTAGEGGP